MITKEQGGKWRGEVEKIIKEHKLKFIQLEVTRLCNLRCAHCGSPTEGTDLKKLLTREEIRQVLEEIAKNIIDLNYFNHLMFVGGEPFCRPDLLQIIKDAYNIKANDQRAYTNTQIQTNGIYLGEHPEILDKLKRLGVTGFGISLDGLEKTHDSFRRVKGAFKKTERAIREALKRGFSVSISTVVNRTNISELSKLSKFIREKLKPNYWRIMLIDPIGRARMDTSYLLSPKEVKQVIRFIYKEHTENIQDAYQKSKGTKIELGCGGWCGREIEGMVRPYLWHCIAGISMLGIMYDGEVGGCTNISRDFLEGNIRKDSITKVWGNRFKRFRKFDWKKKAECINCNQWEYCDGGPMHYRLKNGQMVFCLYQTLFNNVDFRKKLDNQVFKIKAGN